MSQLGIQKHKTCWVLQVDALVLNAEGSLLDALSIAVKAALADTKIPKVTAVAVRAGAGRKGGFARVPMNVCNFASLEKVVLLTPSSSSNLPPPLFSSFYFLLFLPPPCSFLLLPPPPCLLFLQLVF
jgi:hypothetical protein